MGFHSIVVLRPSDKMLMDLFNDIKAEFGADFTVSISEISAPLPSDDDIIKSAARKGLSLFAALRMQIGDVTVEYNAGKTVSGTDHNGHIAWKRHAYYSTILINGPNYGPVDKQQILNLLVSINGFMKRKSLLPNDPMEEEQESLQPQVAILSAIQNAAADQIARSDEFFSSLTLRYEERDRELNATLQVRRDALEREYKEKEEKLQFDQAELKRMQEALDDRSNTHARRAIRGEVIKTLRERQDDFSIPRSTLRLRWPIHGLFLLLVGFTLSGAVWSLYVWGLGNDATWNSRSIFVALKTILFGFGFLTSAGLYISWMNKWFDKHADAQFQTKQVELDFNRATWAIESALEWRNMQNQEMPDTLMLGITRNLFDKNVGDSESYSPLDALASGVLGTAANVKMHINGTDVEFDRKSMKQMKKNEGTSA